MRRPSWLSTHLAALRALLVLTVLLGLAYPLAVLAVSQLPGLQSRADGSLVTRTGSDTPVGSRLIGVDTRVPTGAPVAITRIPISGESYVTPHMAAGGTRAGTGGTVYMGVLAENGANGFPSSYPVPDVSGVVWSEQEYQDGKKVIGGITYTRWDRLPPTTYGRAAAG